MKTQILDSDALRAISPSAIAAYARGEGWEKTEPYGAHADVYVARGRPEIIVPRSDRFADYAAVVSRLIGIFSEQIDLDEIAVYSNLVGADRDVVRVRTAEADDDGSVPLDVGVRIVSEARDMLLAAACAARTPQPLYRAGANKEATDYMRSVRLGQTERGSFVVTLLAPTPPLLQHPLDPSWVDFENEPFERKVTLRLVDALEASRSAAELALSGDGGAFDRAVASGVSANLCEAVANLIDQSHGVDVSVTWARTRPRQEVQRKVTFSANDAAILKEAARTFRLRQPKPDVTLFGFVHKLKRDQDEAVGAVTLKALIDDKLQSVTAVLDEADYAVAVAAHGSKTPVIAKGDLVRTKQRWQLTNANVLEVPNDDEPAGEE